MITHSPIIEDTLKNGGGTFRADLRGRAELPATGFMVSVSAINAIPLDHPRFRQRMTRWLEVAASECTSASMFVGTWVDDGKVFIDVSECIEHEHVAVALCRVRDQKAFFNIAENRSVAVPADLQ